MLEYRGYDISNISPFTTFTDTDKLDKLSINLSKNGKELIQVHYEVESTRTNHKS